MATSDLTFQQWNSRRNDRPRSLWLQETLRNWTAAPALEGEEHADICIVGGGYTGLWTALRLKDLDPALDVVVLEADCCGSGASGRNGGIVHGWWPKFATLASLVGQDDAVSLSRATTAAVDEIGEFEKAAGVDFDFARGGWYWTATNTAQLGAWDSTIAAAEAAGLRPFEEVGRDRLAGELGSDRHLGGVVDWASATIQPAALASALRVGASARGVRIFEQSPVEQVTVGSRLRATTSGGSVTADRIILALNAWMAHLDEFRKWIVTVSSDVVATEEAPNELAALGWGAGTSAANSRIMLNYYRGTRDGRFVFGQGGGTLAFRAQITRSFDLSTRQARTVVDEFRHLFPLLAPVRIACMWAGPVERSVTGLPWFGALRDPRILGGIGYSGNGVAAAVVGGKILASIALDREDEWTEMGQSLTRARRGSWPPEPIRYLGGRIVQSAVQRKEQAENAGRSPAPILRWLSRFAPQGLTARRDR